MRPRIWTSTIVTLALLATTLLPLAAEAGQRRAASSGRPVTGPVVGRAVPRPPVNGGGPGVGHPIYPGRPGYGYPGYPGYGYPAYPIYGYGYPYYGYGYGYGYPYGFSIGFSFGYPWYGYAPAYPAYGYGYPAYGGVRLDLPQRNAEVFVEGAYVGKVDEFDGTFQQLNLEPGNHQIEIREPGRAPVTLDIRVQPGRTTTYRGDLDKQNP